MAFAVSAIRDSSEDRYAQVTRECSRRSIDPSFETHGPSRPKQSLRVPVAKLSLFFNSADQIRKVSDHEHIIHQHLQLNAHYFPIIYLKVADHLISAY